MSMTAGLLGMLCAVAGSVMTGSGTDAELTEILRRVAHRGELHEEMLYRLHCVEEIERTVHRRRASAAGFGVQPEETIELRHGIVIVRNDDGAPSEMRVKLTRVGEVRLDRKGRPREINLPPEFAVVAGAVPHAQVAKFGSDDQNNMIFRRLGETPDSDRFRIDCTSERRQIIEFLDKAPPRIGGPRSAPRCDARASGQFCIDVASGEIVSLEFYGLFAANETCQWDFSTPFAHIRQGLIEQSSGLRFPDQVETIVPLGWRDTARFVQRYTDCVFSDVRVFSSVGSQVNHE